MAGFRVHSRIFISIIIRDITKRYNPTGKRKLESSAREIKIQSALLFVWPFLLLSFSHLSLNMYIHGYIL